MAPIELIIILMSFLVGLNFLATKLKISYPILLVLAGLIISIIPGIPDIKLSPNLVFLIFLPPLLFEASVNISWHDFKRFRKPIFGLAIGLVFLTTLTVACCIHYLIPEFSWPLACLLGAIVSPPDAIAATSATQGMRLPKIITTVLEGESLVNDASALIIYRCAITATLSGSFNLFDASFQFFIVSSGGIIIGLLLGILINWILTKIHNSNIEVSITLMTPYISYLAAEHLHLSGVLAVVTTGIYLAWHISETFSFESRMKAFSFWTVFCFILNGFVFILIGLQLPEIIHSHSNYSIFELSCYGLIISLITILTRLIWIFPISKLVYRLNKFLRPQSIGKLTAPQSSHLLIAAWSGMRGVVSLASALALPITLSNGNAFPLRNEILFITFIVILVTLVGQGLTLPFLVKKLQIEEPLSKIIEDDRRLRIMFLENTINFINNHLSISLDLTTHNFLLNSYQQRLKFFNTKRDETITTLKPGGPDYTPNINPNYLNAEAEIIKFQRKLIIQLGKQGDCNEEQLRQIEQDLDAWNLTLHNRQRIMAIHQ